MIRFTELHLKDIGPARDQLRSYVGTYAKADNQAGDADQRKDRVELSDGNAKTEAILDPGFFRSEMTVRSTDDAGNVTITSFSVPEGLNFGGQASGSQITRTPNGSYSGVELVEHHGWETSFMSYDNLSPSVAQERFHFAAAQLNHKG